MIKHPFIPHMVLSAGADAIRQAIGERVENPHPLADAELSLADIAYAAGSQIRLPREGEHRPAVYGRGISSNDFSRVLADAYRGRTLASYSAQAADVLAFCTPLEVRDFKPVELPALDADLLLELLAENAEAAIGQGILSAGGLPVKLTTLSKKVLISRVAIINDEKSAISEVFAAIGASSGRIEARFVADALETPPEMNDGLPVFGADHLNTIEGALSAATLGASMALLRTQPTSAGQRADLRARFLVVSPELEFEARRLIRDGGLDIAVAVLANLPAHRWYLLADPVAHPVVAVLRLFGVKNPVRVEQKKTDKPIDGALVQVSADLGACLLRRTGIVRGAVAV